MFQVLSLSLSTISLYIYIHTDATLSPVPNSHISLSKPSLASPRPLSLKLRLHSPLISHCSNLTGLSCIAPVLDEKECPWSCVDDFSHLTLFIKLKLCKFLPFLSIQALTSNFFFICSCFLLFISYFQSGNKELMKNDEEEEE